MRLRSQSIVHAPTVAERTLLFAPRFGGGRELAWSHLVASDAAVSALAAQISRKRCRRLVFTVTSRVPPK